LWAPVERRLRQEESRKLKSISTTNMNDYWREYFQYAPTTVPASLAVQAGVTTYVVQNAVPRFVSTAGDAQLLVDWHLDDRIIN